MVKAIVGANWGDEGKGKITDVLAGDSDVVIRFQGGSNAGHTIVNEHGRFALHQLPSGVFYPHVTNLIGNGVALDLGKFLQEVASLQEAGIRPNLLVSDRVQVVMPYHVRGLSAPPSRGLLHFIRINMQKSASSWQSFLMRPTHWTSWSVFWRSRM
jgi:adenylosuccinate synthase